MRKPINRGRLKNGQFPETSDRCHPFHCKKSEFLKQRIFSKSFNPKSVFLMTVTVKQGVSEQFEI
jgi:hypothetical protein